MRSLGLPYLVHTKAILSPCFWTLSSQTNFDIGNRGMSIAGSFELTTCWCLTLFEVDKQRLTQCCKTTLFSKKFFIFLFVSFFSWNQFGGRRCIVKWCSWLKYTCTILWEGKTWSPTITGQWPTVVKEYVSFRAYFAVQTLLMHASNTLFGRDFWI